MTVTVIGSGGESFCNELADFLIEHVMETSVEEHTPNNQPRKYNLASYSATLLHVIGTLVCSEDSLKYACMQ